MTSKKLFATIAVSAMLLTGCTFGQPKDVIVKVNGDNVTETQFNEMFDKAAKASMFSQMGIDVKKDKTGFLYLMIKDRVVNELIVKTLINEEVAKRGIKVTKEDTDKELKAIIDKVGSKEKFNEVLKQNGISADQFKKDLVEEVKMKKLVDTLAKVTVSEADAKKFYKENISKFKNPDQVRASHILISASAEELSAKISSDPANKGLTPAEIKAKVDTEIAAKLEKAQKLLAEVKKDPASFAKVATVNSEDPSSAKQGGDLGFFSRPDMVEPFATAAFSMKPNTLSGIIKTQYGYHIILVTDRKKSGQEPFEKVKSEIVTYLESQAQVKVLENLIESLKKQAKIEYINPEYNPTSIQEALKQQAKSKPAAKEEIEGAIPAAAPVKK